MSLEEHLEHSFPSPQLLRVWKVFILMLWFVFNRNLSFIQVIDAGEQYNVNNVDGQCEFQNLILNFTLL